MPFNPPDVPLLPNLPMEAGKAHERLIAEILAAGADVDIEALVIKRLDPTYEFEPADRAVLWDARVIERVYEALSRIARRISRRGAAPPQGVRGRDLDELRVRVTAERKPMATVVRQLRDEGARKAAADSVNTRAHRIAGMIHHHTVAAARAMLRKGKTEEQILASLRAKVGGCGTGPVDLDQ